VSLFLPPSATHPFTENEKPSALRPDGSNSEEAVAGDRSSIDPLSEVKKRRRSAAPRGGGDKAKPPQQSVNKRAPSLTEADEEEGDVVRGGSSVGP
jgi:hypothetical protein